MADGTGTGGYFLGGDTNGSIGVEASSAATNGTGILSTGKGTGYGVHGVASTIAEAGYFVGGSSTVTRPAAITSIATAGVPLRLEATDTAHIRMISNGAHGTVYDGTIWYDGTYIRAKGTSSAVILA